MVNRLSFLFLRPTAALIALTSLGCTQVDTRFDFDEDGHEDGSDCDPEDGSIYPGAPDPYGDDIDQNCDGSDGIDSDGDGYVSIDGGGDDCNDLDPEVNPGAEENIETDADDDCSGENYVDADEDGDPDHLDCDPTDPTKYSEDRDGDGSSPCDEPADCDDQALNRNQRDIDQDGYTSCGTWVNDEWKNVDCDDTDAESYPYAPERCDSETRDNDCDGSTEDERSDEDGDGHAPCPSVGENGPIGYDCEDTDPERYAGRTETCDPEDIDNDCNELTTNDGDADGDGVSVCEGDCDDSSAEAGPGKTERCDPDNIDEDCDGLADLDDPDTADCLWEKVAVGADISCGLRSSGDLECWGATDSFTALPDAGPFRNLATRRATVCGIRPSGALQCADTSTYNLDTFDSELRLSTIALSSEYVCGLDFLGRISCWGLELMGRLSPPEGTFLDIDLGVVHGCGVTTANTVACWGSTVSGATAVPGGEFTALAAGELFNCGLRPSGEISCWGLSTLGGNQPPTGVFSQLDCAQEGCCGVNTDQQIECWGGSRATPGMTFLDEIPTDSGYFEVSVTNTHACAVKIDNTLVCWGSNYSGETTVPVLDEAREGGQEDSP